MRASKGVSEPLAASVDSAPVTRAAWNTRSIANRFANASAVENWVPLRIARPSFGPSTSGGRPARASAAAAGMARAASWASPMPSIAAARCASGARSPDAPAEPWLGIIGITRRASMASSMATVAGRTPEAPRPRLASLRAIISRTCAGRIGSPTPAACESTILRWSVASSCGAMRTLASFPKPVLMP